MKRIKLSLGISLLLLTCAAMLVTNLVILPFWAGEILARESRHLQHMLKEAVASEEGVARFSPLLSLVAEIPGACLVWGESGQQAGKGPQLCRQGLHKLLATADAAGATHSSPVTSSVSDLFLARYVYVIVAAAKEPQQQGVAGIGVPNAELLGSLWGKERIIALYLLFNALILTALAFFRLLKSYVLPVDQMVEAAENYRGGDLHSLWAGKPANELGLLAESIQAMVQRIESDKKRLAQTVDELAEKNRQLCNNQREMVRAEKLATVGRLAAGLAHEIGNPLGVAQGYLQLLAMEGNRSEERAQYVSNALGELHRVDGLIRQLLDYARASKGLPQRFDVHGLLIEVAEGLKGHPFLDSIRFRLDLGATACEITADREQLRQVILNGLFNAADAVRAHREPGEGEIVLSTGLQESGPDETLTRLRIAIMDNGGGIKPEVLEAVFEPFFTTKEPGAGTGLGLSVSQSLIESMGGTIRLESVAGQGATLLLHLPLADPAMEAGQGEAARIEPRNSEE